MTEEKLSENEEKKTAPVKTDKKGFDDSERLTLKINVNEANQYQAEKGKKKISELPVKLKKPKKKILDSHDEDEEEWMDEDAIRSLRELQINQKDASNADNSLINALTAEERTQILQNTRIEITRHEENAGKQNALEQVDTMLRKADLKRMNTKEFMNEMRGAIYNPSQLRRKAMSENIAKQMGIKGEVKKHNEGNVVKGVLKVKEVTNNRKTDKLTMDDVQKVGEKKLTGNETAELILKKSGQTARLSEIKRETSLGSKLKNMSKDKDNTKKKPTKSYSSQMKDLLRESLKKNDKVGR